MISVRTHLVPSSTDGLFARYQCGHRIDENHTRVVERIRQVGRSDLVICAPVEAELCFGVNKSNRIEENRRHLLTLLEWLPSLPFSGEATRLCGEIRADLARTGKPIGPYDLQISAIALANDCVLATHNTAEFSRIAGLKLEDWEVEK